MMLYKETKEKEAKGSRNSWKHHAVKLNTEVSPLPRGRENFFKEKKEKQKSQKRDENETYAAAMQSKDQSGY